VIADLSGYFGDSSSGHCKVCEWRELDGAPNPGDVCDSCYIVVLLRELEGFKASGTCVHRYSCMACGVRVGPILDWELA